MIILLVTGCALEQENNSSPADVSIPTTDSTEPVWKTTRTPQVITGSGNTYYVATDGKDTGEGTITQPWSTIQHAADFAQDGDTILIRGGIYYENVRTVNDGSVEEGYITFTAYQGEQPIIDGTGVENSQNGFIISNNYIRLYGLELCNWDENAIWIEDSAYLDISYCIVHDVRYGIGVSDGTHDFFIDNVEAYNFDLYGFDVSPSGSNDCYNGTFNECVAHSARDQEQNVDGFALGHGKQHDFSLNRCRTHDVYDGFDISSRDTTLNGCTAYNCWNAGYKIWQDNVRLTNCLGYSNGNANVELDWDGDPGITRLSNCTLVDADTFNIWVENSGDSLHMFNCILAGSDGTGLTFEQRSIKNYRADYNIFHNDNAERAIVVGYEDEFTMSDITSGKWASYSGQDSHSQAITDFDTIFLDLDSWDLHLRLGSPAIDTGNKTYAASEDLDGNTRPQGKNYDIGAYENSP